MYYILDTNIWVELAQGKISCANITGRAQLQAVVPPFAIIELMKETVKHKDKFFANDKRVFECVSKVEVLPLTKVFVYQQLWNSAEAAGARVGPDNYKKLLQMVMDSASYDEFIEKTKSSGSEWHQAEIWNAAHEDELDKELAAVEKFTRVDPQSIATGMAKLYPFKGTLPKVDLVEKEFSAALEYLRSAIAKVKNGANLAKNDRGMYGDFQFLFYLADPNAIIVTNERFSGEISKSPQKDRVITLAQFLAL